MSFDTSSLFTSVVIGLVGLRGAAWMIAIAVALVAALWLAVKLGW
jgi:hypothetical protein